MGEQRTFASVAWTQKGKVTRREQFLAAADYVSPPEANTAQKLSAKETLADMRLRALSVQAVLNPTLTIVGANTTLMPVPGGVAAYAFTFTGRNATITIASNGAVTLSGDANVFGNVLLGEVASFQFDYTDVDALGNPSNAAHVSFTVPRVPAGLHRRRPLLTSAARRGDRLSARSVANGSTSPNVRDGELCHPDGARRSVPRSARAAPRAARTRLRSTRARRANRSNRRESKCRTLRCQRAQRSRVARAALWRSRSLLEPATGALTHPRSSPTKGPPAASARRRARATS